MHREALEAVREVQKKLHLPDSFFVDLLALDDWSFVIKLHALLEGAIAKGIVQWLKHPALIEPISRLPLSDIKTGKLALARAIGMDVEGEPMRFIRKLSELRNVLVHDITNFGFSFQQYFLLLDPNQKKATIQAYYFEASMQDDFLHLQPSEMATRLKEFIWLGAVSLLWGLASDYRYCLVRDKEDEAKEILWTKLTSIPIVHDSDELSEGE